MAKQYSGAVGFANGFSYSSAVPMDDRSVVATVNELLSADTWKKNGVYYAYQGMPVVVAATGKTYTFLPAVANDINISLLANWYTPSDVSDSLADDLEWLEI